MPSASDEQRERARSDRERVEDEGMQVGEVVVDVKRKRGLKEKLAKAKEMIKEGEERSARKFVGGKPGGKKAGVLGGGELARFARVPERAPPLARPCVAQVETYQMGRWLLTLVRLQLTTWRCMRKDSASASSVERLARVAWCASAATDPLISIDCGARDVSEMASICCNYLTPYLQWVEEVEAQVVVY